jgi:hypothetical protein
MSRPLGNGGRDALKFGELFGTSVPDNAEPSRRLATEGVETGRARPTVDFD